VHAELARLRGVELQPAARASDVRVVDSEAAVALLTEPGSPWLLLDVRTASEFEADHAPQAIHIPVDELPQRYQELGQTDHILCVCQAGGRSAAAAQFLTSIGGAEIGNVEGGMSGWSGPRVTGGEAQ
jgi:rhodanese-related sulfurtransferase